jgi:hypothetical protein
MNERVVGLRGTSSIGAQQPMSLSTSLRAALWAKALIVALNIEIYKSICIILIVEQDHALWAKRAKC